jgi:hypothetical protein
VVAGLVGLPIYLLAGCEGFTRRDRARSKVRRVGCRTKRRPNRWLIGWGRHDEAAHLKHLTPLT